MAAQKITVSDDADEHRYVVFVDGDAAGFAAYRTAPGQLLFTHTKIDPDYEGHGVGSALARAALDDARSRNLAVVPRCPFIGAYIKRHPEYQDLIQDG